MGAARRSRRRGSVRARGSNRWEVVVTVKDPLTGKYRKMSRLVRGTRRDAERRLSELQVEADSGSLTPKDTPTAGTYAELLDQWLDRKIAEGLSVSTITRYRHAAGILREELGTRRIDQVDTRSLDSLYGRLLKAGQSPASIAKVHQVARSAGELAVTYGLVRSNPAVAAKAPRILKPVTDAPEPEVVRRLIEEAAKKDRMLATFLRLGSATGARRGELCALRWSDLRLDDDPPSVLFSRAVTMGEGVVQERKVTKTGVARRVTLDAGTAAAMQDYRTSLQELCGQHGVEISRDGWVFSSLPDGSRIPRPDSFTAAFSKLAKRVGVDVTLYEATRHFAASTMIGSGIDATTAAARLGHDATTLLRRYSHVRAGADEKAAGIVGSVLD